MAVSGKWTGCQIDAKEGETVTMTVSGSTIRWSVGGAVRAQVTDAMIGDAAIQWVPCIWMIEKGDRLRWE